MTSAPKPRRSVIIMVASSLLNACCGLVLTFLLPRLLSVEEFGAWRVFLLYAGYAGLLHLGLVDGSLLVWSRNSASDRGAAFPPKSQLFVLMRFIVIENLILLAIGLCSLLWASAPSVKLLLIALAAYSLLFNLVCLFQVYLQTGLRFDAVAFGSTAPPVLFILFLGVILLFRVNIERLLIGYLAAWLMTALRLLWLSLKTADAPPPVSRNESVNGWRFAIKCASSGWPIVLANFGFGLMQSADRVTVNATRPLHDFAVYSLSQSTIYLPISLLAALSRVTFSWFSRAAHTDRGSLYRSSTRLITLIWTLLVPYYYVVEVVVHRFLPRYAPGLPAGRVLLLSVLFLSLIQMVQLNHYNLQGQQRTSMIGCFLATVLAFATAYAASMFIGSLTAVAWSQVVTSGIWWIGNEWFLRRRNFLRDCDIVSVIAIFTVSVAGVYLGSAASPQVMAQSAVYYGFCAIPIAFLFRAEMAVGWDALKKFKVRRYREL